MSKFIIARSDQQNADDFLGGPRTIKITSIRGTDEADQPVAIGFEGDDGKPFKPSKTVRRVLVAAWGDDGKAYVGRSLTLYRDDSVMFGGIRVGGIRVSHMSHIDREMTVALSFTRGKKAMHTIKPLRVSRDTAPVPVSHAKTEGPSETAVIEPDDGPLDLDVTTASRDQIVAWAEAFKALGMKHKTANALIRVWKERLESQIKPLHELHTDVYDVLEGWMQERVKRLKSSG